MLSSSHLETVACRFEPTMKDLRSFLKDNDVAYGFPEHLLSFTDRLTDDESLRYAFSLKLHTVLAELPGTTSHGDLVEVLLLTVGGFAIDEDTPPMQKAERTLSRLIGEVMTKPQLPIPVPPPLAPIPPPPTVVTAPPLAPLREEIAPQELQPVPAYLEVALPELSPLPALLPEPEMASFLAPAIRVPSALEPTSGKALLSRLFKRPTATPPTFAWTPAPRFVWAALVCGVLFPPGMYLMSQPHGVSPAPQQHRAKPSRLDARAQTPQPVQAAGSTDLDRQTDEDLASIAALGFGSNAGRSQVALTHLRKLRNRPRPTAQDLPGTGFSSASDTKEAILLPRETDMPGRDLNSLAPASYSPRDPQ